MKSYLFRAAMLLAFSIAVIFSYYSLYPFHGESSGITYIYIGIIAFAYICYKAFYIGLGYSKIEFTPFKITCWFLLHLLILCFLFFYVAKVPGVYSMYLFFKILFFISVIGSLFGILTSFGEKVLNLFTEKFSDQNLYFQALFSLGIGFASFLFLLVCIGTLGIYGITSIGIIVVTLGAVSYKEIHKNIVWFFYEKFSFDNHELTSSKSSDQYRIYLLSTELLFIIATGIICVNLINVVRPFPIGWDDLGAYMNYPKLLASSGGNIAIGRMYVWELFTGMGFLLKSQSFAFFLNSFSAILSFFVIYLGSKSLLPEEKKSLPLNIPLLVSTVFIALPMVIFQVAKDMKLDIGLFVLSFIGLIIFYYIFLNAKKISKKDMCTYVFLGGCILGMAFSVKITSLLLISGIVGILFYRFFNIWGFVGYIFLYIALFTSLNLWSLMNVVYPEDNSMFIFGVSIISAIAGIVCLGYSFMKEKKIDISHFTSLFLILILGMIIPLIPWQIKHIEENRGNDLTVAKMLGGTSKVFRADYGLLYEGDVLEQKRIERSQARMSSSGAVQNEDFGRYFGYEEGINNYLKLPWNLSMQANQRGEFTDITYIFLALLPALLLFLPYRNKYYYLPVAGVLVWELIYLFPTVVSTPFTAFFSHISLPGGYLFLLVPMIGSAIYFYYTLDREKYTSQLFLINYIFTVFYIFLWSISAFGVVWYGIVMYGAFLLMIHVSLYSAYVEIKEKEDHKIITVFIAFFVILLYFFQSAVPHYLSNLEKASYTKYKMGQASENTSLFISHPEYLEILFSLNIDKSEQQNFLDGYSNDILGELEKGGLGDKEMANITRNVGGDIALLNSIFTHFSNANVPADDLKAQALKRNIFNLREEFYEEIILPPEAIRSNSGIFRVGTFLKYFIVNNNTRLLEDNLLTSYDIYLYDEENPDLSFERMKKIGLDYLLVDLNAATIDNDPRKDLTRRYENLLQTFTSDKVSLIRTDSVCLALALDMYEKNGNKEQFFYTAGVNNHSYNFQGGVLTRENKIAECHKQIIRVFLTEEVGGGEYSYLQGLKNFMVQRGLDMKDEGIVTQVVERFVIQGYKVLFEIK